MGIGQVGENIRLHLNSLVQVSGPSNSVVKRERTWQLEISTMVTWRRTKTNKSKIFFPTCRKPHSQPVADILTFPSILRIKLAHRGCELDHHLISVHRGTDGKGSWNSGNFKEGSTWEKGNYLEHLWPMITSVYMCTWRSAYTCIRRSLPPNSHTGVSSTNLIKR